MFLASVAMFHRSRTNDTRIVSPRLCFIAMRAMFFSPCTTEWLKLPNHFYQCKVPEYERQIIQQRVNNLQKVNFF